MEVIREWLDHGNSILTLPGWRDSGPQHWQTRWESKFPGIRRVQQHDWEKPVAADWVGVLQQAVENASGHVILVAHSLGCIAQHHWAIVHGSSARRIAGALLVAPADPVREGLSGHIQGFLPLSVRSLPYRSIVVASDDDPVCQPDRSAFLANRWGSPLVMLNGEGHINADSGLGDWDFGLRHLRRLIRSHYERETD
ncbi:MAG: hypothetical protein H6R07_520 [Proteobacteria bacterium]|nr:hypothetical protein [Pseudomonadota bacterium]